MDTVVQVLVKDHAGTIVAECPQLIANNDVESKITLLTVTFPKLHTVYQLGKFREKNIRQFCNF